MKANVDFPKRAKNSFIYFQVGLIATMVVVLFILEFNFENKNRVITDNFPIEITPERTFVYNPAPATKPVETTKPVVVKVPKVVHVFKPTKQEIKKEENITQVATQDNQSDNHSNTESTVEPKDNGILETPKEINIFSVEKLPMFPSCKGLSRADQKACFDEQMAKAILKHLIYPEADYKEGKQGVAQIEFVIDENGAITNVVALDNKRATLDMQKAAEKAIKRVPKLIPAMHGDKPVRIKYSIPVGFRMK
jgi:TonB family protein